jgi:regulator of RNase E activity RraA
VGDFVVDTGDFVVADDDGAIFLPEDRMAEIAAAAGALSEGSGGSGDREV